MTFFQNLNLWEKFPALKAYLLIMKISFILFFLGMLQVSASVYSQSKLTYSFENKSIKEVLEEIEQTTELRFFYNEDFLDMERRITIKGTEVLINDFLASLLETSDANFKFLDNNLIVIAPTEMFQQNVTISGKVTDAATDEPLPGVNIIVKGTTTGALTDFRGNYTIQVEDKNAILVFSFIGYASQEIVVDDKIVINIVLSEEAIEMEEVVVLAYGKQVRKENLTGSVAVVNTDVLADKVTTSVSNTLQGAAAGVTVMQQNSYPGMVGTIMVRNKSSWQGSSDPLFVIDGVISTTADFSRLNPNDVESVSVLKDAASAAIAGMRAGNVVILVTRMPGSGAQTQMSYQTSYTMQSPTSVTERVPDAYTAALLNNKAYRNMGATDDNPGIYTSDELEYFKTHSYDPVADLLGKPAIENHNLSLSGGSDKTKYYISGSYLNQDGYTKNYNFKKYSILAKLNGDISKNISFNLILNMAWNKTEQPYNPFDAATQDVIYGWTIATPRFTPNYINGKPVGNNLYSSNMAVLAEGKGGIRTSTSNMFKPVMQLKYKVPFVQGLALRGVFAYDNTYDYSKIFAILPYNYQFRMSGTHSHIMSDEINISAGENGLLPDPNFKNGIGGVDNRLSINTSRYNMYDIQGIVDYDRTFGKHTVSGLAGYQQWATSGDYLNAWAKIFVNTNYQEIDGADPDVKNRQPQGSKQNLSGQSSYFARVDYDYAQKYFIGFTFRADGTYIFPPENRWGFFPAASAAWNISEENFFKLLKQTIDLFKLRVSYGLTGSSATNPWQWQQSYNYQPSINYILDGSASTGVTLGSVVNPRITWEKNRNFDIGTDISILKGMGTLSLDYWYKKTTDILGSRIASTPNTVGATLPSVNYGEAAARGFEVTLGHNKTFGQFHYSISGNFAISSNEYLLIDQAATVRDYQNLIGRTIDGRMMGFYCEGIIRTQADVDRILAEHGESFTILGYKPVPGMLMYSDIRGPLGMDSPDGKVDWSDRGLISSNFVPRISYGFNINTAWKGLALDMNFAGFAKYEGEVDPYHGRLPYAQNGIWFQMWNNFWTPETPDAPMPDPTWNAWIKGGNINEMSTFWLRDRSFLRLKYLNMSLAIPQQILKAVNIQGAAIYLGGENLLTFSKYYLDPEQNGMRQLPVLKSFTLGAKITF